MTSFDSGSPPKTAPLWILAVDASTPQTAIALGRVAKDGLAATLVSSFEAEDGANQTSHWLIDKLRAIFEEASIQLADLDAIACGCGPGTFTGTRVAIATCQGLAFGLGRDCIPVSTLAAIAGAGDPGRSVLALLDARRKEVYAGHYQLVRAGEVTRVRPLSEDRCGPLAELLATCPERPLAMGPGVAPYREELPDTALALPGVSARGLWNAAVSAHLDGLRVHPRSLEANYLRRSYAELGVNQPKRPFVPSPFRD